MKAQWLDVWEVRYLARRITTDAAGKAVGEEWEQPTTEMVLAGKDGSLAASKVKEAVMDARFPMDETVAPELRGQPMYTDFRLASLRRTTTVALFPGVLPGVLKGGKP